MKIAFTGTHSTGKTTLLNDFNNVIIKDCVVHSVTEVAREIINKGYPLNMDATTHSYMHYINDQLTEELRYMSNCDLFISDRTLLDPVAYAIVNSKLPRPYIPNYFIEMMENIWLLEKDRYDIYIYFPIEFDICIDGVRPIDDVYRIDVDKEIYRLLNKYNVNYIVISGAPEERVEQLKRVIREYSSIKL